LDTHSCMETDAKILDTGQEAPLWCFCSRDDAAVSFTDNKKLRL